MITRNGTDTVIGIIPGPDIDEGPGSTPGGLTKARDAFQAWAGWKGKPALGSYTYPSGGKSETWDFVRAQGAGPMSYRSYAIPAGFSPADVRAGKCDQLWAGRAASMVAAGAGEGWYFPGYEGDDHQFPGSAGLVGIGEWAYAVSRQIRVMRSVAGWDNWIGVNFNVHQGRRNLVISEADDPFSYITEPFQSIDLDLYPVDDFSGAWSASTDQPKTWAFMLAQLEDQAALAAAHGVPLGIGEYAPMLRADKHSTGDDPQTVASMSDWVADDTHNVAHLWLYNGHNLPSDDCRFATYSPSGQYLTRPELVFSAQAITANFDPARFVGRPPSDADQLAVLEAQLAMANEDLAAVKTGLAAANTAAIQARSDLAKAQTLIANAAQLAATTATAALQLANLLNPQPTTPGGTS